MLQRIVVMAFAWLEIIFGASLVAVPNLTCVPLHYNFPG